MKRSMRALAGAVIFAAGLACVANAQQAPAAGGAAGARGGGQRGPAAAPVPPGPPQPVPPQVAIPRPTAAEVAQMNEALTRLMNADKSAAKPLLDKYRALTTVQVPRDNSAIRPVPRNAAKHDSYVELAKKGDIDLLLVGDSITDLWRNSTETYANLFRQIQGRQFCDLWRYDAGCPLGFAERRRNRLPAQGHHDDDWHQ